MRTKRKNVCQECRSRKLACDGKLPACSQCTLREVSCSGYQQEFLFVPPSSGTRKQAKLKNKSNTILTYQQLMATHTDNNSQLTQGFQLAPRLGETVRLDPRNLQDLEDDVSYILQYYTPVSHVDSAESNPFHNQICGAWVEALPFFLASKENNVSLHFAIKTLATSLRCLGPTGKAYKSHAFEMYCTSLGLMGKALGGAQGVFHIEHCVAIMCLAVSDKMIPEFGSGWTTHIKGVRDWVESLGPESFSSGILRTLFVGFRPILLINSILSRKSTFLAEQVWTTTPFRGQTVSMMQQIFNQASKLPSLLERFDIIRNSVEQADFYAIGKLLQDFRDLVESLQDWESAQCLQAPSPLIWARPTQKTSRLPDVKDLWFLNLMVANSLTHCWAFKIIAKSHLGVLVTALAARNEDSLQRTLHLSFEANTETSLATLAGMICDSMTYLLQPETKLFGPSSTFFILLIAIQVFKRNPDEYSAQILRCQQIAAQIAALGIPSPSV